MGINSHIHSIVKKTNVEDIDQGFKNLNAKLSVLSEIRERKEFKDGTAGSAKELKITSSIKPMDGSFSRDLTITADPSGTIVTHGIGRPILGFIVINRNNNSNVWNITDPSDTGIDIKNQIRLVSDVETLISLWIF